MSTEVISLKGKRDVYGPTLENESAKDIVYVGRQCFMGGWKLRKSPFANPYKIGKKTYEYPEGMTREDVVKEYRNYILSKPELVEQLPSLKGKKLACWCAPKECHGDIIKQLIAENNFL
jgi:hypothetical protein